MSEKTADPSAEDSTVIYNGGLVIGRNTINLYGSDEECTAFTDTVRLYPEGTPVLYGENVDFIGDSGSIGVSANAWVFLLGCTITSWKTSVLPYGDHTWEVVQDCLPFHRHRRPCHQLQLHRQPLPP